MPMHCSQCGRQSQLKPTSSLPFRSLCPEGRGSQGNIQGNKKILGSSILENKQNDKINWPQKEIMGPVYVEWSL